MATVNMLNYKIKSLTLNNDITANGQLQITNSFGFNVRYVTNNENKRGVATLTETLMLQDHPEMFRLELKLEGVFDVTLADEEDKKDAHVQCYDTLFPYAAQILNNLMANSGMQGFMLKKIPMSKDNISFGNPNQKSNPDSNPNKNPTYYS